MTMPTDKKAGLCNLTNAIAFIIPKALHQLRTLRPLATQTVTATPADNPVDVRVRVSGVTRVEMFQAMGVTRKHQIHYGSPLWQFPNRFSYCIEDTAQIVTNFHCLRLVPLGNFGDVGRMVEIKDTSPHNLSIPRFNQPLLEPFELFKVGNNIFVG